MNEKERTRTKRKMSKNENEAENESKIEVKTSTNNNSDTTFDERDLTSSQDTKTIRKMNEKERTRTKRKMAKNENEVDNESKNEVKTSTSNNSDTTFDERDFTSSQDTKIIRKMNEKERTRTKRKMSKNENEDENESKNEAKTSTSKNIFITFTKRDTTSPQNTKIIRKMNEKERTRTNQKMSMNSKNENEDGNERKNNVKTGINENNDIISTNGDFTSPQEIKITEKMNEKERTGTNQKMSFNSENESEEVNGSENKVKTGSSTNSKIIYTERVFTSPQKIKIIEKTNENEQTRVNQKFSINPNNENEDENERKNKIKMDISRKSQIYEYKEPWGEKNDESASSEGHFSDTQESWEDMLNEIDNIPDTSISETDGQEEPRQVCCKINTGYKGSRENLPRTKNEERTIETVKHSQRETMDAHSDKLMQNSTNTVSECSSEMEHEDSIEIMQTSMETDEGNQMETTAIEENLEEHSCCVVLKEALRLQTTMMRDRLLSLTHKPSSIQNMIKLCIVINSANNELAENLETDELECDLVNRNDSLCKNKITKAAQIIKLTNELYSA